MPVTPHKARSVYVTKSTTQQPMGSLALISHILLVSLLIAATSAANSTAAANEQDVIDDSKQETITVGLPELLHTENVLIQQLREYIHTLENQIAIIKRKTLEIKAINDVALNSSEKYVNNPLNAITILKRFTTDWRMLRKYAAETFTSEAKIVEQIGEDIKSLIFPSEDDFDDAAGNLLRIQDIYKLAPERLAVGEMNGIKLGSEMSWSDCLEIGKKSHQNGDYMLAKFWMETALGKLPPVNNDTTTMKPQHFDNEKGKFEIMETMIEMEFESGNTESALDIVNELLAMKPTHKRLQDVRKQIENAIAKEKKNRKSKDVKQPKTPKLKPNNKFTASTEELLVTEICRDSAAIMGNSMQKVAGKQPHCSLERGNSNQLLLQPLKMEYISIDPYIVIYHDILNAKEVNNLKDFIEENDTSETFDELTDIKFTAIGLKKIQLINKRLQTFIGHSADLYAPWKVSKRDFETLVDTETLSPKTNNSKLTANVLFNLQSAKLGGAIVFPQLELSVNIPQLSIVYWSHLNEFNEYDYRTKQHICPIIAGTQITVYTYIKHATQI